MAALITRSCSCSHEAKSIRHIKHGCRVVGGGGVREPNVGRGARFQPLLSNSLAMSSFLVACESFPGADHLRFGQRAQNLETWEVSILNPPKNF